MKNFFMICALIVAASSAQATAHNPANYNRFSELTSIELDPSLSIEANEGLLKLNAVTRKVQLTLMQNNCPPNAMCIVGPLEVREIELPIVKVATDGFCGSTVYYAKRDRRPVDGGLELLKITDLTTMKCRMRIDRNRATQIDYQTSHYNRFTGEEVKTLSHFEGTILHSVR